MASLLSPLPLPPWSGNLTRKGIVQPFLLAFNTLSFVCVCEKHSAEIAKDQKTASASTMNLLCRGSHFPVVNISIAIGVLFRAAMQDAPDVRQFLGNDGLVPT